MAARAAHRCRRPPPPQQQGCSGIYSALCTKLHATQPLARDVSTLLEGEGGFMMITLEGLGFTASYLGPLSEPPCLSQLPQRPTVSQDMALSRALGPGDMHPAPMFFHLSPSKSLWVPSGPLGPIRVPPGLMILKCFTHLATLSVCLQPAEKPDAVRATSLWFK